MSKLTKRYMSGGFWPERPDAWKGSFNEFLRAHRDWYEQKKTAERVTREERMDRPPLKPRKYPAPRSDFEEKPFRPSPAMD